MNQSGKCKIAAVFTKTYLRKFEIMAKKIDPCTLVLFGAMVTYLASN